MRILKYFLFATLLTILACGIAYTSVESEFTDGLNLIGKKKYDQALIIFQKVVSHYENTGDVENHRYVIARYYRAKCNFNLSNLEDALNDFLFVDKANIPTHQVWQDIINVYLQLGRGNLAIHYLEEKIKESQQFGYYFELGRLYWRTDDRQNAINAFEEAAAIDSSDNQLLFFMSYLYWEIGDIRNAGRTAQLLEKISFDNVINQYARGLVYLSMGLYEKAADEFRFILNANPDDNTMRSLLLDCLIKSADFDSADSLLRGLIENNREDEWFWFKACEIALLKRDRIDAETIHNFLDIKLQKHKQAVCLNAFALVMASENEEAENILERSRERDAENPDFYPILAALKYYLDKPGDVADLIIRFNENVDGDFPVDEALYWYLTFKGSDATSTELTNFATISGSENPEISSNLALLDFAIYSGDLASAIKWIDILIQLEKDNPEYSYLATILSLRLGDKSKAVEYWDVFSNIPVKIDDWEYVETEMQVLLGD